MGSVPTESPPQCDQFHTNNMGSTNVPNQNASKPQYIVITKTRHGSSLDSKVSLVEKLVPVDDPVLKRLLELLLDDRHIQESVNGANDLYQNEHGGNCTIKRDLFPKNSTFRGVIKCTDDRFEAFARDNTIQGSRGRTVYIGGYSTEIGAARAHDLVSLKIGGLSSFTNFPVRSYLKEIEEMQSMRIKEYIYAVRGTGGKGFSGRDSDYRGVYRISAGSRWQAWLGLEKGIPSLFLGTYYSAEDAARGYDIAQIRYKGMEAITNFEFTSYDVSGIMHKLPNPPTIITVLLHTCPPNTNNSSSSSNHRVIRTKSQNSSRIQTTPYHLNGVRTTGSHSRDYATNSNPQASQAVHQISHLTSAFTVLSGGLSSRPPMVQTHDENLNSCSSIGVQNHWSGANFTGSESDIITCEDDLQFITQYLMGEDNSAAK